MLIVGVLLLSIGIVLLNRSYSSLLKRDKRFNRGVKLKMNSKAFAFLLLGVVFLVIGIKFILL